MITLPKQYQFLLNEPGPRHLKAMLDMYGVKEVPGKGSNPEIMKWAKALGLEDVYLDDDTAWCGLAEAYAILQAGRTPVKDPLWARNWLKFGVPVAEPRLGTIIVYQREGGGGHVNNYVGEDATTFHGIGGNQSNAVGITRILKTRAIGFREPAYNNPPANLRKIIIGADGPISTNEA